VPFASKTVDFPGMISSLTGEKPPCLEKTIKILYGMGYKYGI